ncbi:transcriptional regulator [Latilactobacillus curvatus]|uniref:Transcriptional regulator n=2 Tax=Latilactobacillus curvatus TaxID=28038 RepID=A0AAC9Y1V6_LATCU|nr:transcriptional regulator [Latilactobacillus curvatus]
MKAVINMTDETQSIMALFAQLIQSRSFVASAWMTVGKERRRDFMNTKGKSRLLNLLSAKDGLTNAEITELLDIRPSSVSLQVKALEEEGYVMRQASEADKRVSLIFLTDKGRASIEKGDLEIDQLSETILAGLSEAELKELQASLTKIAHNVKHSQFDAAFFERAHQMRHHHHGEWNRSRFPW